MSSSFTSDASQYQAENTVNKLFSNILHTNISTTKSTTNANQLFAQHGSSVKKNKKNEAKRIKKNEERTKAFNKFVKYNYIKNKENKNESDKKYLSKLVRKNVNKLNSSSKIDDFEINEEFNIVSSELLDQIKPKNGKRLRKKLFRVNENDERAKEFNEKLQKGVISHPGLTPGLAPVDYNESDSE